MEPFLVNSVERNLRDFMHSNAICIAQRLCEEFPSEANLQLLASAYLQNNQPCPAYAILKGNKTPQCRYLFAMACYEMGLLNEAEESLIPPNDRYSVVPNGAAGQFLLGLIYRQTQRNAMSIQRFRNALSMDPAMWIAHEELTMLGASEEKTKRGRDEKGKPNPEVPIINLDD